MASSFYTSISGYKVKPSAKQTPIDASIVNCFIDSITQEFMRVPVFIPNTAQIYDKESIIRWFGTSNIDPLTGEEIEFAKINIIPILPYILFLLCVEKREEVFYFHHPFGTLGDMLEIAKNVASNAIHTPLNVENNGWMCKDEVAVNDVVYECKTCYNPPTIVSLDITDYYFKLVECKESSKKTFRTCLKNTDNTQFPHIPCENIECNFIDVKEILGTCFVTKRALRNKCRITTTGIVITSVVIEFNANCGGIVCGSLQSLFYFPSMFFNNPALFSTLAKTETFTERELTVPTITNASHFPKEMDKETQKWMKDYNNILHMNIIYTAEIQKQKHDYLHYMWKVEENNNQAKGGDFYIEMTNTHKKMLEFYHLHNGNYNVGVCNKISGVVNDENFAFKGCGDLPINELKKKFGFPIAGSNTYGDDFAFLALKGKIVTKDFKGDYFIGTQFVDCMFIDCVFSMCSFVMATFDDECCFIRCKFRECSFYKMGDVRMVLCTGDTKTMNSMRME